MNFEADQLEIARNTIMGTVMGTMTGLATYLLLRLTREQTKTNAIRLLDRWQKLTNDAGATVTSS
ncbi:MAG TPA: hypothetical protein VFE46_03575, partial [Pirellulales bacterium]|nr:hypothetical protein [Pirellulales bacterium]